MSVITLGFNWTVMSAGSGVDWILFPITLEVLGREGLDWNGIGRSCPPPSPPSPDDLSEYTSLCHFRFFLLRMGSF
jgi:hypothetical protein